MKSLKLELKKVLIALESKILYFPMWRYRGGTLVLFNVV